MRLQVQAALKRAKAEFHPDRVAVRARQWSAANGGAAVGDGMMATERAKSEEVFRLLNGL